MQGNGDGDGRRRRRVDDSEALKLHDRQAWQWIGGAQWANNK